MSPANSIEIAIWVAVGGRGTLVGAALGAGIVNGAKSFFTQAFPEYWLYFLGCLHPGDAHLRAVGREPARGTVCEAVVHDRGHGAGEGPWRVARGADPPTVSCTRRISVS
jgi:hypothetical protein